MAVRPKANLIRKPVRTARRVTPRDGRINGQVYDEPLHKHDWGPLRQGHGGPLNEQLPFLPPTYRTYRRMDRSPFIAMAKEWKLGPVRNATGSWQAKDDTIPNDRIKFVQDSLEPFVPDLLASLADALSMGNSPNRKIWELDTKPAAGMPTVRWKIDEVIPLDPERTHVLVTDEPIQRFAGLSTPEGDLSVDECIYFRYDPRPYDGYWWHGRSLHENHRDHFAEYEEDRQLMHRLARKLSGVVAIAKIIKGMARDSKGNVIDRMPAAQQIVQYLFNSMGAVFESIGVTEDEIKRNPKLAGLSDIMVEPLDLGSSGPAYETMLKKRQQSQRECVMGYLVPPPAIMDVQTGGKSDTETKTETGLTQSEVIGLILHQAVNQQLVDPFLVINFGPDAAGSIFRRPTKFTEEQRRASDRIMSAIVNNPDIFAIALKSIDIATTFRDTNTPMRENVDTLDWDKELDALGKAKIAAATAPPVPPTKANPIKAGTRTKKGNNRGMKNAAK